MLRVVEVLLFLGSGLVGVWAAHLKIQAQKHLAISEGKDEVIRLMTVNVDSWKSRYDAEHGEYVDYRDKQHIKDNDSNAKILRLTTDNTELRAKTDLTPVTTLMQDFIKEQTEINTKVLSLLTNLEKRISVKCRRAAAA